jgi:hypothetical protein
MRYKHWVKINFAVVKNDYIGLCKLVAFKNYVKTITHVRLNPLSLLRNVSEFTRLILLNFRI